MFFFFIALRLWIAHYLYLHIRSSAGGMRASRSRFSWLRDSHIDGFRLSSSRSILLLLLCCVEVCMDLALWPLPPPTPMAARHEARHEFLLVEIIEAGWSTGLTVEVNEVCAWFCVVFLSWNLNIFKLNEYFESRAGTFIFEYVCVSVCSCSQKFIKFFTLPRAALAVILTANRTEISLYLFMFTHGHTRTLSYTCVLIYMRAVCDLKETISFTSLSFRTGVARRTTDSDSDSIPTWRNPFDRSLEGEKRVWMKFHCQFVKNDAATPTPPAAAAAQAARQPNWRRRHNRRCLHKNSYVCMYACACMCVRLSCYIHMHICR